MNGSKPRLAARDYKQSGRRDGGFDLLQYRQFGAGLVVGLLAALGVWLYDHRSGAAGGDAEAPQPRAASDAAEETPPDNATDTPSANEGPAAQDLAFYDMLPSFEVEVPKGRDARAAAPASRVVEQPGAYVVQAGSYRNQSDAERVRSQLAKLGIAATIQNADNWHRVRIGPFRDLGKLNATTRELRAADIDAIVMRVGD
ncbi:MAG: SPOR domain-containing protein [Steroidobacteraceae bacterium]